MTEQYDDTTCLGGGSNRIFKSKWSIALASGVVWLVVFCVMHIIPQTAAILQMRIFSDAAGEAQWYFDRGRGFSESEMVSANIHPGENDVTFRFPQGTYRALRFDPINHDAHTRVEMMQWKVSAEPTGGDLGVEKLEPLSNIDRSEQNAGGIDIGRCMDPMIRRCNFVLTLLSIYHIPYIPPAKSPLLRLRPRWPQCSAYVSSCSY